MLASESQALPSHWSKECRPIIWCCIYYLNKHPSMSFSGRMFHNTEWNRHIQENLHMFLLWSPEFFSEFNVLELELSEP